MSPALERFVAEAPSERASILALVQEAASALPATEAQLLPIDSYTISSGGYGAFAFNPDSTSRTLQAGTACARR